jgi:hypothetical protein
MLSTSIGEKGVPDKFGNNFKEGQIQGSFLEMLLLYNILYSLHEQTELDALVLRTPYIHYM